MQPKSDMPKKKPKLYFVYAVPYAAKYRALSIFGAPLYRKYWKYLLKWPKPISAPFSITYNILKALDQHYKVLLYDVVDRGVVDLGPDDKFVGHFWPDEQTKTQGSNYWTSYDPQQVANTAILKYPLDKRVFAISPFNHSMEQMGWAVPLLKKLNCYIPICGDYWVNNIEQSEMAFLQGRMSHINMGITLEQYPKVKTQFNMKGKRKFLYIGRISKEKNIQMLEDIAANSSGFEGGYIGNGIVKGWHQIAPAAKLTPEYVKNLAAEYDFFINTSTYDAQATTILEAISWGFVTACTPQTGYTEDCIFELSASDVVANVSMIGFLNNMDEDRLHQTVAAGQALIQEKFSWARFTSGLKAILEKDFGS
jgi:glycosyltransferase involved in cell wall biosynthesis